ncbi:MAG: metal ABC transporter permease [Burkholderiales bacterium]|nr:metal ABC transporter permease [Burkholderiales bacterium]
MIAHIEWSILLPALLAGLLVLATHVPLGIQVLNRGIVFIDLAIAQIAGLGVIGAQVLGLEPHGIGVQLSAVSAALLGSLLLAYADRRWPEVQEALIGVVFVLAATGGVLLLAHNPHGGEHLKDLLVGQILWVNLDQLPLAALVSMVVALLWFTLRERLGRIGFYILFACAVTVSVQLVGIYLVFASLIVPAMATRHYAAPKRLGMAYLNGVLAYALGLFAAAVWDLPAGAVIVWAMVVVGLGVYGLGPRRMNESSA